MSKGDAEFRTPCPERGVAGPPWWLAAVAMAVTAFGSRLMPLLHGGGFFGIGNYDDGVYFSAAVALVHGRLPYRDFVFLHPPGIVLALAPFAVLGRIVGEDWGFAIARATWMGLGTLNAVLVARILRPVGLAASVFGGLSYAVFYPAVYVEISTQLQGLSNTLLLAGLALLVSATARPRPAPLLVAGALGIGAVCLPFFLAPRGPCGTTWSAPSSDGHRSDRRVSADFPTFSGCGTCRAGRHRPGSRPWWRPQGLHLHRAASSGLEVDPALSTPGGSGRR